MILQNASNFSIDEHQCDEDHEEHNEDQDTHTEGIKREQRGGRPRNCRGCGRGVPFTVAATFRLRKNEIGVHERDAWMVMVRNSVEMGEQVAFS